MLCCCTETAPQTDPVPAEKKGRLWIPAVIMGILFVLGLGIFLLFRADPAPVTDPEMPWFTVYEGTLYFHETKYTGGTELQVPAEIGGQTVVRIGDGCFAGSEVLTTVILPNTIQEIGVLAFADSTSIRGVFLPNGVTQIGDLAFCGCTALESVCIPYTVEAIGSGAFEECPNLMHIFYTGTTQRWMTLYTEKINEGTCIYAADGTLLQG